jgi:hypothetical protein
MATERPPAANRQNATPEGRAVVHLASLTHGFTGRFTIGSALHRRRPSLRGSGIILPEIPVLQNEPKHSSLTALDTTPFAKKFSTEPTETQDSEPINTPHNISNSDEILKNYKFAKSKEASHTSGQPQPKP